MGMRLTFLGAGDTVTGSRALVQWNGQSWLVDCGLFQGDKTMRERNRQPFAPDPRALDGIIVTHAHLDHTGYLPRIVKEGFRGKIHATDGTADLCRVLLHDAAKLEHESAKYANETKYSRHDPATPLFTEADADAALALFERHERRAWIPLGQGLSLRFLRAGHIIGASLVQLAFEVNGESRILTFSGDLGNDRSFMLRGPEQLAETDVLVIESTYGDRCQPRSSALDALGDVVRRTADRGGVLVIPAFAVGRSQEVTYMLRLLEDRGLIPRLPVVLDSPMAQAAMDITLAHPEDHVFDSAFNGVPDAFRPSRFETAVTPDQSMLFTMRDGPFIVITASGMLNGGRVLHHLKRRLPDARNTVLFTGYQAEGTKGRFLQEEGAKLGSVRIHHQDVEVAAEIATLTQLSSHADADDIMLFLERMRRLPKTVFVNHGVPGAQRVLAARIAERFGIVARPAMGLGPVVLP